jgi:low affinity Fe/Cu permease
VKSFTVRGTACPCAALQSGDVAEDHIMAQKRAKLAAVAAPAAANCADDKRRGKAAKAPAKAADTDWSELFSRMACTTAHWTGKPIAFLIATALVIIWAATGPMFRYSDTWQLVINTSTTIVTFLMVFLIQNTQNRDTMALQLKLSELILSVNEAENRVAAAEDLSDEELEDLHRELHRRAESARGTLDARRAKQTKAAS